MVNDKVNYGEQVVAVLKKANGEKRVIDGGPPKDEGPKYKIEVKVTDLRTGEVHKYEVNR